MLFHRACSTSPPRCWKPFGRRMVPIAGSSQPLWCTTCRMTWPLSRCRSEFPRAWAARRALRSYGAKQARGARCRHPTKCSSHRRGRRASPPASARPRCVGCALTHRLRCASACGCGRSAARDWAESKRRLRSHGGWWTTTTEARASPACATTLRETTGWNKRAARTRSRPGATSAASAARPSSRRPWLGRTASSRWRCTSGSWPMGRSKVRRRPPLRQRWCMKSAMTPMSRSSSPTTLRS
mmetsp:Transcript_93620/g.303028  ORF Transcript_93620/g.303028 Transcript_93620/m.303028 type:complete len:241 (-) Transcript_93620:3465-4187(-)